MDLFESLPWRISEPSVIDVGTKFIKEESIATSFVFLNNFVPEEKFNETEKSPKPRTRKGNCKILNKNRKSCINSVQHKQCLQALQLIQSGRPLTSLSKKEQQLINIYYNLRMAIQQENAEFLKYVEGQWNQNIKKCKNNLYKYALQNRNEKINNVTNYPQFYANHRMIPLSNDEHPVEVLHDACLLEMGMVSKIQIPEVGRNLQMIFPAVLNENMCELTDYLKITKQPVSEDMHAEFLAKQTACNFVISSSSLKTIIDNFGPDFNATWNVPVTVKEYDAYGRKMTVVYIDKALPQKNISLNDVHLYSLKKLLKHRMQEEIAHSFIPPQFILHNFNIQKQVNDKNITINKADNSPKTPENTKTNESDNCSTPKRQKLNPTEIESPESGTANDSTKIYECVTPIKQINKSPKLKSPTIESPSKMLTRSASKKIDSSEGELNSPSPKRMTNAINYDYNETEEEKQLNIEENRPECIRNKKIKKQNIKSHNVNYRLWTLKIKDGENVMMKNFAEKREIKILVRSKIDGFEIGETGQITPTSIIPKLESQTLYGGEIATKSDLIRQWITLYFRPLSNLLRVRLNSRSSSYVMIENLNLNKITNECLKHHNFSPKDNIGVLYSVLANMIDLKPGNYVLRHTPKLGPFAALLKSVPENSQNDFNLYDFYEDTNCHVIATAKWVPIDTNCILSSHIRDNIMPGMFSPQNFGNKKNGANKKWKNKKKKMRRKLPVHMKNGDTSE